MDSKRHVGPHLVYAILALGGIAVFATLGLMLSPQLSPMGAFLAGINTTAFFCMGLDKSLAQASQMRIPEATILGLSLLGGVPGVVLGINIFKHKTRKASFQCVLLLIGAAQLGIAALLLR